MTLVTVSRLQVPRGQVPAKTRVAPQLLLGTPTLTEGVAMTLVTVSMLQVPRRRVPANTCVAHQLLPGTRTLTEGAAR